MSQPDQLKTVNNALKPHWTTATELLRALAEAKRFGFFSDFDGTLCRFTMFPDRPNLSATIKEQLTRFTEKLPLVSLVSGRGAPELRDLVALPEIIYVGNHGLEMLRNNQLVVVKEAREWESRLTSFINDLGESPIPTVRYHPKRITMSITYGRTENPEQARLQILEALKRTNESYGFMFSEGHSLWEVKPPINHNKGTAISALIKEFELDAAIFLGDDYTDVPALEAVRNLRDSGQLKVGLSVAVRGSKEVPPVFDASDVMADDVTDVERLLIQLAAYLPA